jgi:IS30 family transposase
LSDLERGHIIGGHLAGASVTRTATLLGVLRVTVPKVMLAYTNHGKTTSAKRYSGQKAMTERDHRTMRIVLKNHGTIAAHVIAQLNIHLENIVSTKSV